MTTRCQAIVASVEEGSPADRAGVRAGERLVRLNGRAPRDYIEFRYLAAERELDLLLVDGSAKPRRLLIRKELDEDLGLRFSEDVFDGVITCTNRCPFCFVSQLPTGLRPSLYLRDDDYRLSFLHGNFITLTNLTPADRSRIAELHLSPLYVSVHATEPDVREQIFGGPTPDVLSEMRRLGASGMEFHCQIVVCPGVNDGAHLERTVRDLAALHPAVQSVGAVPVGLTRHRGRQPPIRPVTAAMSRRLIEEVHRWQSDFRRELGTRLVFAADELYLQGSLPLPRRCEYEKLPQLGNGIGGARLFLGGLRRIRPPRLRAPLAVGLVTGKMAAPLVRQLAGKLSEGNVRPEVCVVANDLFGRSVTTAGLLAGRDIARALQGLSVDLALVPGTALKEGTVFLDDMTLHELSDLVGVPLAAAGTPAEATAAIRRFGRRRHRR
jgi:putative radical SAM enzyme (TIGR03279 family)